MAGKSTSIITKLLPPATLQLQKLSYNIGMNRNGQKIGLQGRVENLFLRTGLAADRPSAQRMSSWLLIGVAVVLFVLSAMFLISATSSDVRPPVYQTPDSELL